MLYDILQPMPYKLRFTQRTQFLLAHLKHQHRIEIVLSLFLFFVFNDRPKLEWGSCPLVIQK